MNSRDLISQRRGRAVAIALVAIFAFSSLGGAIFAVAQAGAMIAEDSCTEYDDSWVECEETGGGGGDGGGIGGGGIGDGGGWDEGGGLTPEEEEGIEIETGGGDGIEIEMGAKATRKKAVVSPPKRKKASKSNPATTARPPRNAKKPPKNG